MKYPYNKVYLEITNICNMSCSFCHRTRREPRRMSYEEFRSIIRDLTPLTEYIYYHIMGEPLTHPLLPEFIAYASSLGFKSAVTTNGTLLKKRGDELIDSGVYKVSISVHSFEEGGEEEYAEYLSSCFEFADKASKRGILTVFRLWNKGKDGGRNEYMTQLMEKYFPRSENEYKESPRGIRIRDKLHLEYGERFEWPDPLADFTGEDVFCYGLKDQFGILCDGTVVPCCLDSDGNIPLGNVFDTPIEQILTSPRAEAIRTGFARRCASEELCKHCGYAKRFG